MELLSKGENDQL